MAKVGAILVNINPAYKSHELIYALNKCQVKYLVMDTRCGRNDFLATLLKALEDDPISCLEQFIFLNNDAPVVNNALDVAQTALKFKDVSFFSDLYEAGDSSHVKIVESNIAKNRFDDIINIQVRDVSVCGQSCIIQAV